MPIKRRITAFLHMLRYVVLGDLSANRVKYVLTILGIALGIAIFVAVETANLTINESLGRMKGYRASSADLFISARDFGFDEKLLTIVDRHPEVKSALPLVVVPASIETASGEIPIQVYGTDLIAGLSRYETRRMLKRFQGSFIDIVTDPESIILSASFAEEYGISTGQRVIIRSSDRTQSFVVKALAEVDRRQASGENYALLDIALVQWKFERLGLLDRIDITLKPGADPYRVEAQLRASMPPYVDVFSKEAGGAEMTGLVSSFQMNVTILSLISLLVGMFLVYNTVFISYIRKRRQIGILRALGVTRGGIFWIFSAESLFYGTLGGFVGIWLGYLLSYFTVDSMSTTVNMLYAKIEPARIHFSTSVMSFGMFMGIAASFVSSLIPAMEAARVSQAESLARGSFEVRFSFVHRKLLYPGIGLLALAYLLSLRGPVVGIPVFGYLATMCVMFGMALLTAPVAAKANQLIRGLVRGWFGAEGFLAHRNLGRNLGRSSVILCAIMVSLGMSVSFMFMIHSFRSSLENLINQVIKFDFVVADRHSLERGLLAHLPKRITHEIEGIPDVGVVEGYSMIDQPFRKTGIVLMSVGLDTYQRYDQIRFLSGDKAQIYDKARSGEILISEALSTKHDLEVGDSMELRTPAGTVRFPVAGIFYNYQFERGMAYLDRSVYERYYPPDRLTGVHVYVKDHGNPDQVFSALEDRIAGPFGAVIVPRDELKRYIMEAFDQTFAITYALQLIAIVVAVLAVVNTFSAAIMERRREIGILRCIGLFRSQVRKMILVEAGIVGGVGCLLGVITGTLLALILIFVINKQSFGWSIHFHVPLVSILLGTLAVFITTLLAGVIPAARAASTDLGEAFRHE